MILPPNAGEVSDPAMSLFSELKRRNVIRVGTAYLVTAWLIIQVVQTIFPAFGFGDAAVRTATIVLGIGLVPTLVLAWVFELTPDGLRRERDVAPDRPAMPQTATGLDRMIMVVLALALGYFAFDKFVLEPRRYVAKELQTAEQVTKALQQGRKDALVESYGDKSIAVLAFEDMSPDRDQQYLSDGIAEELLNLLTKVPELRVISRSSAFSYRGKDIKLSQIADELMVEHILEGSVRKSGNRVRITAQLIDARSDTHLWSETYDRTLDDVFAVQDEIAATVVDRLKITLLGPAPRAPEAEPQAYALYLKARHLSRQGTAEGLEKSTALYQQVLAIDPDYAAAWVGLSRNYTNQANKGLLPWDAGYGQAREAAEIALSIDPDNARAHALLGWIATTYDNDLSAAARHYERALALDSTNPEILGNAAALLPSLGRPDQATAVEEYVARRDPLNPTGHFNLGVNYLAAGRWDEAIASFRTVLRLSPAYIGARYHVGTALLLQGDAMAALDAMEREESEVFRMIGLAMVNHRLGRQQAADAALAKLIANYERQAAYNIAYVLAFRNEADRAFEWLDKAVEFADPGLSDIISQPEFSAIRGDPRWPVLMESLGKSPAQLDAIAFEVTVP